MTHEVVDLLRSTERADVFGEQVGVSPEEPEGLRAHLEPLHVLVGALRYRPHEMPACHRLVAHPKKKKNRHHRSIHRSPLALALTRKAWRSPSCYLRLLPPSSTYYNNAAGVLAISYSQRSRRRRLLSRVLTCLSVSALHSNYLIVKNAILRVYMQHNAAGVLVVSNSG